jgi:AcrR family transcriptional regulator
MNEKFNELPEEKRLRIINAGFEVFSKSEYKKASTDDIAARAGISKGLLFYYFHDKKSLYLFLLDYAKQLMTDRVLDQRFFEITDVFELLEYAASRKYQILSVSPYILDFMMRIVNVQNDAVAGEVNKVWEDTSKEMYASYFSKMDYSKFREDVDPQEIIQMLLWTAEGYMYDRQRFGSPPGLEDLMEKFRVWTEFYKKIAYKEEYLK